MVGDSGDFLVVNAGDAAEAVDDAGGDGGKLVVILELGLEKVPEHPVLDLVSPLDLHVVVNPHDPLLCPDRDRPHRAFVAVAVEVDCHVIFLVRVRLRRGGAEQFKVDQPVQEGVGLAEIDVQILPFRHFKENLVVKDEHVHLAAAVVDVAQDIQERLLYPAHVEIALKNRYVLHNPRKSFPGSRRTGPHCPRQCRKLAPLAFIFCILMRNFCNLLSIIASNGRPAEDSANIPA